MATMIEKKDSSSNSKGESHRKHWSKAVLHLDMDAFFVNVHILDHPEDAGIPLAVGGRPETRGVISSASYEARHFGVRSAMPSGRAMRLCPQLKIVGNAWPRIRECSRQVMAILAEYGPVEKMSVDEAYVNLDEAPDPEGLARKIQQRVKAETKLPASVGLATSKLVAKVASDYGKPEGCTFVRSGEEGAFLAPQPVRVISGIGPRTAEKLAQIKISTCGQLADRDIADLVAVVGNQATSLKRRAQGIDNRTVKAERGLPKSISVERTFNRDISDAEELKERLRKMSTGVAKSLQRRKMMAHTVKVKFRWADFTTFTRQRSSAAGFDGEEEINRLALLILKENWPQGQAVRLLGVGVSGLEQPTVRQFDFGF